MNKVVLMGRLVRDPESAYGEQGESQESMCITKYTLAVDRRVKGQRGADFIPCVAFGNRGEFAEKYFRKGTKVTISGRIKTGTYTNKDGQKVYTFDVVVDEQEFAESKGSSEHNRQQESDCDAGDGFMNIPEGVDEELPFN